MEGRPNELGMDTLTDLKRRLKAVDDQIREAEQRLPAHSTKPPTMMMLLKLEDERDEIIKRMEELKKVTR